MSHDNGCLLNLLLLGISTKKKSKGAAGRPEEDANGGRRVSQRLLRVARSKLNLSDCGLPRRKIDQHALTENRMSSNHDPFLR